MRDCIMRTFPPMKVKATPDAFSTPKETATPAAGPAPAGGGGESGGPSAAAGGKQWEFSISVCMGFSKHFCFCGRDPLRTNAHTLEH